MNAKNPKFAIPPKGKFPSVKAGEKYKIISSESYDGYLFFEIISPLTGDKIHCLSKKCAHINGKNWILRNK
jgi:hypothetical protein